MAHKFGRKRESAGETKQENIHPFSIYVAYYFETEDDTGIENIILGGLRGLERVEEITAAIVKIKEQNANPNHFKRITIMNWWRVVDGRKPEPVVPEFLVPPAESEEFRPPMAAPDHSDDPQ